MSSWHPDPEEPTVTTTKHDGYRNYPTWHTALWLANDYDSYKETRQMARDALKSAGGPGTPEAFEKAASSLSESLRVNLDPDEQIYTLWEQIGPNNATIWRWAFTTIDWTEIAEEILEEIAEEDAA